jgi:hypothetical protein
MTEGLEVMERTSTPTFGLGQPTKAVLAQTCMGVFFIHSVSDTSFAILFLPKTLAGHRRPTGELPRTTHLE